jgi:hypothetical protein
MVEPRLHHLKHTNALKTNTSRIFILVNCELINLTVLFILSHDITIILVVSIIMFSIYNE